MNTEAHTNLRQRVREFLDETSMSPSALGRKIGHPKSIHRLLAGKDVWHATACDILSFMANHSKDSASSEFQSYTRQTAQLSREA